MTTESFLTLLSIIGVLFLMLICGFLCRRTGVIDDAASKRLSSLIIKLCQPMMIVGALISKPFDAAMLREGLVYMAVGFLLHPFMLLIALAVRPLFGDEGKRKISEFAITFTNCGFIGFPILETVFEGRGAFNGAFFVIGFHVYIWTLGMAILSRGRDDIRLTPRKALINYGTVPCAIGLLLYLSQALVTMPPFIVSFCNYLGNMCMPVSLLVTGALLATQSFGSIARSRTLYAFNAVKLLFVPLAVCLVAKLATLWMPNAYDVVLFSTVIAALPSAATVTMLGEMYDIEPTFASQVVGTSSLFSLATLPLMYFVGDFIAKW